MKYLLQIVVFGFRLVCALMWGLYANDSSGAVGHVYVMQEAYLFREYTNNV